MRLELTATPVEIFTPSCHYQGQAFSRGLRLADFLSDPTADLLRVEDVFFQLHGSQGKRICCEAMVLRKSDVLIAVPLGQDQPPQRRMGPRPRTDRHRAVFVLPGHVLMGIAQLPKRAGPLTLLNRDSTVPGFVGLTDVDLYSAASGDTPRHFKVAIVRRASLEAIYLDAVANEESEQSAEDD